MNLLRLLLALCLSLAVPTAALAAVTSVEHCSRMAPAAAAAATAADAHAGHNMQDMSHAEHMQHSSAATPDTQALSDGCTCGCDCSSHHCTSGVSGLLSGLQAVAGFTTGGKQRALAGVSRTTSAHHLDLLRPPSLS